MITLEPLSSLRQPPFECKADPELPHRTEGDWFDSRALYHYLLTSNNFTHPLSRRELTRDECVALEAHLASHHPGEASAPNLLEEAFEQRGQAGAPPPVQDPMELAAMLPPFGYFWVLAFFACYFACLALDPSVIEYRTFRVV